MIFASPVDQVTSLFLLPGTKQRLWLSLSTQRVTAVSINLSRSPQGRNAAR